MRPARAPPAERGPRRRRGRPGRPLQRAPRGGRLRAPAHGDALGHAGAGRPRAGGRPVHDACRDGDGRLNLALRLGADGQVEVVTGMPDQGGGQATLIRRVVAAAASIDESRIRIVRRSTLDAPVDAGVGGSWVTHMAGRAAAQLGDKLRDWVDERVPRALPDAPSDTELRNDWLVNAEHRRAPARLHRAGPSPRHPGRAAGADRQPTTRASMRSASRATPTSRRSAWRCRWTPRPGSSRSTTPSWWCDVGVVDQPRRPRRAGGGRLCLRDRDGPDGGAGGRGRRPGRAGRWARPACPPSATCRRSGSC